MKFYLSIFFSIFSSIMVHYRILRSFPGSSDGKESACSVGDPGLIPGLGRSSRILNIVPCATRWDLVAYLFYVQ